jgi:heme exporter protein A
MAGKILLLRAAGFGSFTSKISGMLETTGLACERGGARLFADLSFSLAPGGLLRVRGANGSGKTTLLRALAGLTRPAAGEVRHNGMALLFIGHSAGVKDELTVLENLKFSARLSGLSEPECIKALEQLGIARLADLPARYLSQGQRRRAALARLALSASIPLWLLDEPFAALDSAGIAQVSALCSAHLAGGGMLVLTSHQDVAVAAAATQELALS